MKLHTAGRNKFLFADNFLFNFCLLWCTPLIIIFIHTEQERRKKEFTSVRYHSWKSAGWFSAGKEMRSNRNGIHIGLP